MTTFLDTNVLVFLLNDKEAHHAWSVAQLLACKERGPAIICDIVYCEFSVGMPSRADVDTAVSKFALERIRTQDAALFRAAAAFKEYRARGGPRNSLLPDFLIGATAAVSGAPLVTANARDFIGYFPEIEIIAP